MFLFSIVMDRFSVCMFVFFKQILQLMVNCWFGAFGGLDSWNSHCYVGVPALESQTTKRPKAPIEQ